MPQNLQHAPAQILGRRLIELSLASNPEQVPFLTDWKVFTGSEPTDPDNVLTIYGTTSRPDARMMVDGSVQRHEGIQVRIRGTTQPISRTRADAIQYALERSIYNNVVTLDGVQYLIHALTNIGDVLHLGFDSPVTKRVLHTINCFMVVKQRV